MEAARRLHAERVLVIRLGALGDVVRTRFAFPALRQLYPEARIDWLVEDRAAAGLAGIDGLDEVVCVPRNRIDARRPASLVRVALESVRRIRSGRYDLAIDFHSSLKSALLAWSAAIPQRVGYASPVAREGSQLLFTHRVQLRTPHVSRFERNAALVRFLGGEVPESAPRLAPDPAADVAGLPERFYAIHPGTSPSTAYKRWDPSRFAQVAVELRDRTGVPSVVTWGPVQGERDCAQQVVGLAGGAALLSPETHSIREFLTLLGRAELLVAADSGPVHLCALAGRPTVVIFGPTDPIENAPFPGAGTRILRHDVGCNPCREGCPARACMRAVEPAEVVARALELVAALPAAAT